MAGRYSRNYSNYILRKKHQDIKNGTIWERDWVTIGAKHQIEKGKRPFYGDSGFLYTINNIPSTKKKHDYGKWVAEWFYDDVKDAQSLVNSVEINHISNDIRDFVYYGSCMELISASVLDIIRKFPAVMYSLPPSMDKSAIVNFPSMPAKYINKEDCCDVLSVERYNELDESEKANYYRLNVPTRATGYRLHNPFNVDLMHVDVDNPNDVNLHRFFAITYEDFDVILHTWGEDEANLDGHVMEISEFNVTFEDVYLNNIQCPDNYQFQKIVTIEMLEKTEKTVSAKLYGYQVYDEIIFTSGKLVGLGNGQGGQSFDYGIHWYITIKLKDKFQQEFRDSLDPFEQLLLRDDTNPLYKNTFKTPYETETGVYYSYVDYTWPSTGGVIDIESPAYYDYINKLTYLGETLDGMWTDNLWRNMTHESIKNYDWTYKKDYIEGDEEANINGGNRMEQLIRVYGRFFDDIKRYIDGIKLTNRVAYDFTNNMPYAEMSDKLDIMGWDVFSTIPYFYDGEDALIDVTADTLDDDFFDEHNLKWFYAVNKGYINAPTNDNMFMRDLMLSSKHIFKSKGTRKSLEMVMGLFGFGEGDFEITERYYYLKPYDVYSEKEAKRIADLNNRENSIWDEDAYFSGIPLKKVEMFNCDYIVPFYSSKEMYDGDFTFQSNGGWGADTENLTEATFIETLSYLKVVGNIGELLSLNPYSVKGGDIYYVIDLSDIVNYDEAITAENLSEMTHFFMCQNDIFVDRYSSWSNIGVDDDEYSKAMYLYNIISTDVGNNPHVGYGKYDLGGEYLENMKQPFKYALDNYILDDDTRAELEDIYISIVEKDVKGLNDKVLDLISNAETRNKYVAELLRQKRELEAYDLTALTEDINGDGEVNIADINLIIDKILKIDSILKNSVNYYLDSKVFIFENKIDNDLYKQYFFDVIVHYLMQVIPSTAILVLKGFGIDNGGE